MKNNKKLEFEKLQAEVERLKRESSMFSLWVMKLLTMSLKM